MIIKSSVFILGAGASVPYSYPTGFELQEEIKNYLKNVDLQPDKEVQLKLWDDLGFKLIQLKKFYTDFSHSATYSVDKFLERRPDHIELGKLLIAFVLKKKEHAYSLAINLKESNWYADLANRLDMAPDNVSGLKVSFVTLNYDRSLEYFLYNMLKHKTTDEVKALEAFKSIKIIHVYGGFNNFPWESEGISYDDVVTKDILTKYSSGIKIMSDERQTDDLKKAQEFISLAHNVYFIGFGYDRKNLERLGFQYHQSMGQNIEYLTGTAFGMKNTEINDAEDFTQGVIAPSTVTIMDFIDSYVKYV